MKRLFLLLIICLTEVIINPNYLAADKVILGAAPDFNAVETVIEKPAAKSAPVVSGGTRLVSAASVNSVPVVHVSVAPQNAILISGKTIQIEQSGNTNYVSNYNANRYGEKFIYGHNSANIFGVLYGAYVGQNFTVYTGGIMHNYVVSKVVVYEKNEANGLLQLNGKGNYMGAVSNAIEKSIDPVTGQVSTKPYSLALMTCYGTMLGGGRATHRLVVFANEV